MKQTIKVNLNGQLVDLDNDAYERLQNYLNSIESRFSSTPEEASEILEDIEARIMELINIEFAGKSAFVVSISVIESIISTLGTAEDMDEGSAENEESTTDYSEKSARNSNIRRRLYRDVDTAILGGVASGLGVYFTIDRVWIRIIFLVLTFSNMVFIPLIHFTSFGIIAYLVLWMVVPAARTSAQKLEMNGKEVNIDNIRDSVQQEYEKVKKGVRDFPKSSQYHSLESTLGEFFRIIGGFLLIFLKVIASIVAVSLIVVLIAVIIAFVAGGSVLFPHHWLNFGDWAGVTDWNSLSWFVICLFLVTVIPILVLFAKLLQWIFNLQTRNHIFTGIAATIWVIALICLIVLAVENPVDDVLRKSHSSKFTIETKSDTLYLGIKQPTPESDEYLENFHVFGYSFVWDDRNDELLKNPEISIEKTDGDNIWIETQRNYFCLDRDRSKHFSESICNYGWQLNNSQLLLDKYYRCDNEETWRLPAIKVIVHVPDDVYIQYSPEAMELLENDSKAE